MNRQALHKTESHLAAANKRENSFNEVKYRKLADVSGVPS